MCCLLVSLLIRNSKHSQPTQRLFTGTGCLFDIYHSSQCIHRIASGGYYGFRFVTPPQCVERFHCYRSNEKNIIASLLKFAGYINTHKMLPGNIFGLILKNKMAATGVSLSVIKSAYISLILVLEFWDAKPTYRKSWAGNLLVCLDLTLGPSFKVKRRWPNLKVLIARLLLVLEVCNVKPTYRRSWAKNLLMFSDLTLGPSQGQMMVHWLW